MAEGVVAERADRALLRGCARQQRDVARDVEEGGVDVMLVQLCQDEARIGPGAVVESQRDLVAARRGGA